MGPEAMEKDAEELLEKHFLSILLDNIMQLSFMAHIFL